MFRVAEGEAAGRQLPRRPQCLRQFRIITCDMLRERIELVLDALKPRLVFLEFLLLLHVAPQQAHLLDELGEDRGDLGRDLVAHGVIFSPFDLLGTTLRLSKGQRVIFEFEECGARLHERSGFAANRFDHAVAR